MYDWCMIRCFCASTYKLYHGKMMILCKHGLTEIIMIYCIANQPKNAIFAEKWGGKAFIWGGKPPNWGENLLIGAENLLFGIFTLVIMDISRKLAIEFPDGTIRQFATITEAAQCIGVSVAAVSKAIVNGKDSVKGCKIRGLNNRMFVVRHRPEDPFVICRLTPFGVLKPLGSSEQNEKTGIDPYDCYMCKEIIETKTFSMSVSQRATCDMRRGQGAIVKEYSQGAIVKEQL